MHSLSRARSAAAFTLLEIMLVVMIIALLAGAAVHFMGKNMDQAKYVRIQADLQHIKTQLQTYEVQTGSYPSTSQGLQALVSKPTGEPKPHKWRQLLDAVPGDPWYHPYQIRNPATKSTARVDIFSMGPDGVADTSDDIGNWEE